MTNSAGPESAPSDSDVRRQVALDECGSLDWWLKEMRLDENAPARLSLDAIRKYLESAPQVVRDASIPEVQPATADTPRTGDWWCPQCKEALPWNRVTFYERCDTCGTPVTVAGEGDVARLERELAACQAELRAERKAREEAERKHDLAHVLLSEQIQRAEAAERENIELKQRCAELEKALEIVAEHYTDTDLAAKHMSAHARMVLSGTGNSADYVWRKDRGALAKQE